MSWSAGDGGRGRDRGLSRTDRRTLERLNLLEFLNLYYYFFPFFSYFVFYFELYVILFLFSFQTIWITSDYQGFHAVGRGGRGGGVRGRDKGEAGLFTSGVDVRDACMAPEMGVNAPEFEVADDVSRPGASVTPGRHKGATSSSKRSF